MADRASMEWMDHVRNESKKKGPAETGQPPQKLYSSDMLAETIEKKKEALRLEEQARLKEVRRKIAGSGAPQQSL